MTSTAVTGKRLLRIVTGFVLATFFFALDSVPGSAQLSTDDHLAEPGWWPRRKPADLKEFAGNAACAKCHSRITASQETTPMARTLMRAGDADVLHLHSDLSFQNGKYVYQIKTKNAATQLIVTDGERTITANLVWAFGTGKLGQSYLFMENGAYRESRAT